jgi:hypothetical protein
MTDSGQRQPSSDEAPHAIPEDAAVLAAPRQRAMPRPADSESERRQRRLVDGRSVVAKVSTDNRPQSLALLGDGLVHALLKLGFHRIQLRLQPLAYRLPQHREPSIALLFHADAPKAEKVERRCTGWGLPLSPTASASRSEFLTRLNTRPARSLVNASTPPSRAAPHDSGPIWVVTSHSYDSFIHYTSPV